MVLKIPLQIKESDTSTGAPAIIDADGRPVVSFGNVYRYKGKEWTNRAAQQIVKAVNEAAVVDSLMQQAIQKIEELQAEIERLRAELAEVNRLQGIEY